jgi:hypothetical protein
MFRQGAGTKFGNSPVEDDRDDEISLKQGLADQDLDWSKVNEYKKDMLSKAKIMMNVLDEKHALLKKTIYEPCFASDCHDVSLSKDSDHSIFKIDKESD